MALAACKCQQTVGLKSSFSGEDALSQSKITVLSSGMHGVN